MRIVCLNITQKAVSNKDDNKDAVKGGKDSKFINPDSLTISPQQTDLEYIIQEDEHDETMPNKKPFIFGSDYC